MDKKIKTDISQPKLEQPTTPKPQTVVKLEQPTTPKPQTVVTPKNKYPSGFIMHGLGDKKQETLDFYLKRVDNSRRVEDLKPAVVGLVTSISRIDWWDPKEILEKMRDKEVHARNRIDIVRLLDQAIACRLPCGLSNAEFDEKKHARSVFPQKYLPKPLGTKKIK